MGQKRGKTCLCNRNADYLAVLKKDWINKLGQQRKQANAFHTKIKNLLDTS